MTLQIPTPLTYWKRPFKVNAHIFTLCPVFFKEWAGVDYKQPKSALRLRGAARKTKGLCAWCWYKYNRDVAYAKALAEARRNV